MIKLIHVLSDMKIGGAGRWLLNLMKEIDREAFAVKVVLPRGSMLISKMNQLGIAVIEIDGNFDKSFDMKAVKYFSGLFKEEKPDIVHTHASLSARIGARLAGVRASVNTKHCIDLPKAGVKKSIDAWINMRLSDKFITVSEAVKRNLSEAGIDGNKIETVYGGVDKLSEISDLEKQRLREEWHIDQEDVVIGIAARLTEVKGHVYFIEAAKRVIEKNDKVKFLIAGTGHREAALKSIVQEMNLNGKIIFTGFVDKIEELFNIIDINVISSTSEALCLSLIEGMSLGKCCIGTDTGGIKEVIVDGRNGYLVPVKDSAGLADRMLTLAQDKPLRETMGQAGKLLMNEKFSSQQMARRIEKIYIELVNAGGRK